MTPEEAIELLRDRGAPTLLLEPREQFDPCIVGVAERYNHTFAVYDRACVIASMVDDETTYEEAVEHFYFNILGGWVGDGTPAFTVSTEGD